MQVVMYTDGACSGNPGPGGYGVVLMAGPHKKHLSEGYRLTTNNRMELLAIIVGLEQLKNTGTEVQIYTDSKYVHDSISKGWVYGWKAKGFKGKKNPDLWMRYLNIAAKHKVTTNWVKGHAGNKYNEIADQLAVQGSKKASLLIDEGFEGESEQKML